MTSRDSIQLVLLSITAILSSQSQPVINMLLGAAHGNDVTDFCKTDSPQAANALDFTNIIIRESQNNLDALLEVMCNVFLDLEKVAKGEELKQFLKMFNEKLKIICSNQKLFTDHVVKFDKGESNLGVVMNQRNQQFCKAVRIQGGVDGCSGGLIILLIREGITNPEVGKLACKWIPKLKEILHEEELKLHFKMLSDLLALECNSTDIARGANFNWLRLILEEFETNLEAMLKFSCDALQELDKIIRRKNLKELVHTLNYKTKNTCDSQKEISNRNGPSTDCIRNVLFTALFETISSVDYIDENGSMFIFMEKEVQEIIYNPDFRKFICEKNVQFKGIVQGKELKHILDYSDRTICLPMVDQILTVISKEPESNFPTLLRFSCETLDGFEERIHGEKLKNIIRGFNRRIAKICNNQDEIGQKGLSAVFVFVYYEFLADTMARHGEKSDVKELANELTKEFLQLFIKELSTNTGLLYYLFCERNEMFQSIVHVSDIQQVVKEMNKCNEVQPNIDTSIDSTEEEDGVVPNDIYSYSELMYLLITIFIVLIVLSLYFMFRGKRQFNFVRLYDL